MRCVSLYALAFGILNALTYLGIAVCAVLLWLMPLRAPGVGVLLTSILVAMSTLVLFDMLFLEQVLGHDGYDLVRRFFGRGTLSIGVGWFLFACLRGRAAHLRSSDLEEE